MPELLLKELAMERYKKLEKNCENILASVFYIMQYNMWAQLGFNNGVTIFAKLSFLI